jgi:predicted DNA-binding transcriptional regulator AlpA
VEGTSQGEVEIFMKPFDPALNSNEQHFRVPELAAKWGVSRATIRSLIKNNPDVGVRFLPTTSKAARRCVTALIPKSAIVELYRRLSRTALYEGPTRHDRVPRFDEQHFRVPELAAKWGVSRATIRTLIKNNPDVGVRFLPPSANKKASRHCVTAIISESAAKELYLRLPRSYP